MAKEEASRAASNGDHKQRMNWIENHTYLKETFETMDVDGSGRIDVEELKALLVSFGYKVNKAQTKAMLEDFLGRSHFH